MEETTTQTRPARKRATPAPKKPAPRKAPAKPSAKAPQAAKTVKTAKTAKPAAAPAKPTKAKKPKLVRDSFTIPKDEYEALAELKLRCVKIGHTAKKSELMRAGIQALVALSDKGLVAALGKVPSLKTGRPKNA